MSKLGKRIEMLEGAKPAGPVIWHRIIQHSGQTLDAALDAYGRGRIGEADRIVVRRIMDMPAHHEQIPSQ